MDDETVSVTNYRADMDSLGADPVITLSDEHEVSGWFLSEEIQGLVVKDLSFYDALS